MVFYTLGVGVGRIEHRLGVSPLLSCFVGHMAGGAAFEKAEESVGARGSGRVEIGSAVY